MATDTLNSLATAVNSAKLASMTSMFSGELSSQVEEAMKSIGTSIKGIQYTVKETHEMGNHLAFTYTATGTSIATGKSGSWTGSGIATQEGSKFTSLRMHEDQLARVIVFEDWAALSMLIGPSAAGTWVGTASGFTVTLTLTQSGAAISGTVAISGFSGTYPVTGQNRYPSNPNLTVNAEVMGLAVAFDGNFQGDNQATGDLDITGFPSIAVTIDRQK